MTEERPAVLVCIRTADGLPHVPSFRDRCELCEAEVWRSRRSIAWDGAVVCLPCAMDTNPDLDAIPAPWVPADLVERYRRRTDA